MGKPTGFKEYPRELPRKRPEEERVKDFKEVYLPFPCEKLKQQAARCMDCGVPTCHAGCPLGNLIPDWNDSVYQDQWREALDRMLLTNNSPLESHVADPDCLAPGKNGEPVSRRGAVVDKQAFEVLKDEYYRLRGWDVATGLQTKETLEGLGLDDIIDDLDLRGLIA